MANLTQLKMLEDLDGVLLVDKPAGIAFSTVVKSVKRKFNLVKVGHGGSLDAMASGLLVLMINDANKAVNDIMGADREYTGTVRWGLKTDTHDVYGRALADREAPPAAELKAKIESVKAEFAGDVFQTESRFCSVRKEGTSGYEIADTGDHKPFMAHVYRFDIDGDAFSVRATKGLLVKTLVNDLGEAVGCGAALASLRRTRVGRMSVEDAIPFDRLLEIDIKDFIPCVKPISSVLR